MSSTTNSSFTATDFAMMARALQLAREGLFTTSPNPRVGAVVVKDGKIIGEGRHRHSGGEHAEIAALKQAGSEAFGASCYITLEPCNYYGKTPPCTKALIEAGICRVVVAMVDPNPEVSGAGIKALREAGLEVICGLMEAEALDLNPGFISRMEQQRPWIVSKLAMGLDGRTALASGESQWISSTESRADVHRLRAQVCAIITGSGTVIADNPRMTVRLESPNIADNGEPIEPRQPLKVVIDGQQQLSPDYTIFKQPSMIVLGNDAGGFEDFVEAGVMVMQVPRINGKLDLNAIVRNLAKDFEVNELMVEAGAELNGAFLSAGLIDQLQIYMAPKLMGDFGKGLFHLPQIKTMQDNINLQFMDIRQVGQDVKITAKIGIEK